MKTKDEVNLNPRAEFYCALWPDFKKAALDLGWVLALHGSLKSDMDIVAVPWVEDCSSIEDLVKAISDCIGYTIWKEKYHLKEVDKTKPHGRIVYTLAIHADWYIDLSIVPPIKI